MGCAQGLKTLELTLWCTLTAMSYTLTLAPHRMWGDIAKNWGTWKRVFENITFCGFILSGCVRQQIDCMASIWYQKPPRLPCLYFNYMLRVCTCLQSAAIGWPKHALSLPQVMTTDPTNDDEERLIHKVVKHCQLYEECAVQGRYKRQPGVK